MVQRKISYVNGRYVPHEDAFVHIEDRGYQFSDGVYEVIGIMNGKMFDDELHFKRLERSCKHLHMNMPVTVPAMKIIVNELIRRNRVKDSYIYIQVTRGVAPRNHAFPKPGTKPALTIMFTTLTPPPQKDYDKGVSIITGKDIRWHRKDIKSISLLANILAKQDAVIAGVKENWLVDKVTGFITEGSSTNAYIVDKSGVVRTHPADECILGGVTRDVVLQIAKKNKIKVSEKPFTIAELRSAKEAFITSTTSGVLPVVKADGKNIGNGKPGEITMRLNKLYNEHMQNIGNA